MEKQEPFDQAAKKAIVDKLGDVAVITSKVPEKGPELTPMEGAKQTLDIALEALVNNISVLTGSIEPILAPKHEGTTPYSAEPSGPSSPMVQTIMGWHTKIMTIAKEVNEINERVEL